ncbi:MAG: GNAT family N-acetyltransferase [Chryseobacterium sp.]|jgi:RimJ/RimL family protein N-acetyltransferase|uniref:GNAT family N-acetyltransferase n=1 Tax=Chryseobacterium sp. TaxID=1871047 RepID=UPI002822B4F9|nr:GNAT family N-acetyltransferase [Chryseobacterium sp.]MDR2235516.1 GNAT family N-acetyltransferase [Chryseobacterium sp.]
MKKITETERLLLRELTPDDAPEFFKLNENPDVIRYTGDLPFADVNEALAFLQNYRDYDRNGYGRWAVMDKAGHEFLGWCGLKYHEDTHETDIGFRFFEEHWNKGYASESAAACLQYGFETLHLQKIIGRAMAENIASVKVLQKLGMTFDREFDFDGKRGVIYTIENK